MAWATWTEGKAPQRQQHQRRLPRRRLLGRGLPRGETPAPGSVFPCLGFPTSVCFSGVRLRLPCRSSREHGGGLCADAPAVGESTQPHTAPCGRARTQRPPPPADQGVRARDLLVSLKYDRTSPVLHATSDRDTDSAGTLPTRPRRRRHERWCPQGGGCHLLMVGEKQAPAPEPPVCCLQPRERETAPSAGSQVRP